MRARAIIERALQLCKVLASGETPDAADMTLALNALNALLEAWALSPQMILVPRMAGPFALTSGKTVYTIGPTGDFVAPRPASLMDASFIRQNGFDSPVKLLGLADYNDIGEKTAGGWSWWLNYAPGAADGTITLSPAPLGGMDLYLAAFGAFAQFADFDTDVPMSPGYLRTLQYNLAAEICEDFARPLSAGVARIAANSKRALKRANAIIPMIRLGRGDGLDPIGPHAYGISGDYLTDEGGDPLYGD